MKKSVWISISLILVSALLIPLEGGRSSAPQEKWVARYNGPGNGLDRANAIAVDGSGNVYLTGWSEGSGTDYDYATIKYSAGGKQLWVKRYNGPGNGSDHAHAIAVESSGNVYVTGGSEGSDTKEDYATIKYSTNGKQLWVNTYNGPAKGNNNASAIAVDDAGNVYVTGYSKGSGTDYDYATIKYSTNGKQLWVNRYNGPANGIDWAWRIAVDGSGNVYITGDSMGSGIQDDFDYTTIKYSASGKQLWVKRYNGTGNGFNATRAIAVDGSGNVYVTGLSEGLGTKEDFATIKYSTNGKQLWVKRYNGPGNSYKSDYATDIAVDSSGNVYVTGKSEGSGAKVDYATIKYSTNGKQLWVKRYSGPAKGDNSAWAIAVDSSSNVYVTGGSDGSGTESDYATIKY